MYFSRQQWHDCVCYTGGCHYFLPITLILLIHCISTINNFYLKFQSSFRSTPTKPCQHSASTAYSTDTYRVSTAGDDHPLTSPLWSLRLPYLGIHLPYIPTPSVAQPPAWQKTNISSSFVRKIRIFKWKSIYVGGDRRLAARERVSITKCGRSPVRGELASPVVLCTSSPPGHVTDSLYTVLYRSDMCTHKHRGRAFAADNSVLLFTELRQPTVAVSFLRLQNK